MTNFPQKIHVIDSHTGGEPTRLVIGGGPELGCGSMAERRAILKERHDWLRSAVVNEPRGSDVIVGGIVCEPANPECACGIIFFNNAGYLNMCGHGTIGLVITLQHLGRIGPGEHRIETPVGDVAVTLEAGNRVALHNVPAWRYRADVAVEVDGLGTVIGDIAWGGNWFFLAKNLQEDLSLSNVDRLTRLAWKIRHALEANGIAGENGGHIDHLEIFGPPQTATGNSRNFVLCPGGAYDRSPCGTGTSAKLACLAADGKLKPGETWRQESILGSIFEGSYQPTADGKILPTIRGTAWVTAEADLILHPEDPFRLGIQP